MNYQHLQYFAQVVQSGSIQGAAEVLCVSQPTISAAVRKLEQEFGAKLLDRRREGSVPTEYGRSLYESATTMRNVVQNAHDKIAAIRDPATGTLRIGTGPSVSTEHTAAALATVLEDHPYVKVTHVTGESYRTFEQLLTVDDIDVALCHVPEKKLPRSLEHQLVSNNPICALAAATHFAADAQQASALDVMKNFNWITPRDDEIQRPAGTAVVGKPQRGPATASLAEDLQLIKHLTLTTRSIGFLPLHMVAAELQSGAFVELIQKGATVHRPIYALTLPSRDPSPLIDAFLQSVTTVFDAADHSPAPHRTVELVR